MKIVLVIIIFDLFFLYPNCVFARKTTNLDIDKNKECMIIRAAFDIGSGTTKLKVAKVNLCQNKIVEILLDSNKAVSYKKDLLNSKDSFFSKKIMQEGMSVLQELKKKSLNYHPKEYLAVATQAFRDAKNSKIFCENIYQRLKLKVKILSPKEEAIFGYQAVEAELTDKFKKNSSFKKNLMVWDIGGGSMQFTIKAGDNYLFYQNQLGSIIFKNKIIQDIQKKTKTITSPNPISSTDEKKALILAKKEAAKVLIFFKDFFKNAKVKIIGIGGVHYYSIFQLINHQKKQEKQEKQEYSFKQLKIQLKKHIDLSDKELNSKYTEVKVSNLILVKAFMEKLNLNKIMVKNINMTDNILLSGLGLGLGN